MSKSIDVAQIVYSAQVWVCDDCGCQDPKSCGCDSSAHMEEKAAKKEADRQRKRRDREKAKKNQQSRPSDAPIVNTGFSRPTFVDVSDYDDGPIGLDNQGNIADMPEDTDPAVRVEWFMWRASESVHGARADSMAGLKITPAMCAAAAEVVAAWSALHRTMMEKCDG